jgi:FtsP/CotA-like multicopper oxidase with cupredoxin domain
MSTKTLSRSVSRRDFLKLAGGVAVLAAGASLAPKGLRRVLRPESVALAADPFPPPDLRIGGTDGWIYLPPTPAIGFYHPDNLAPAPFTDYIFGFHNLTGLPEAGIDIFTQKNKAQHSAPLFWATEGTDFRVQLTNLGLAQRPDLFDAHTLHWHGFRNVIPFFDGEPTGSVSVPAGRDFTYVYRPKDPGTYMWHCHVEDVEHVHMGMTGLVFIRPSMGPKFAYNDPSTAFDREFAMFLSEVWAEAHWADAHIQLPDWGDYHADFSLLNGRVYPDTLAPNGGSNNPFQPAFDANGDMIAPAGRPELQYQPYSSLVNCNAGERVLLRFANLGFKQAAITLTGIRMRIVGMDATPLVGRGATGVRDGVSFAYDTDTIPLGAGESADAIFTAPAYVGPGPYDTYMLYNRNLMRSNNLAAGGFGGQATEIRVYPAGSVGAQSFPNDWGI